MIIDWTPLLNGLFDACVLMSLLLGVWAVNWIRAL